MYSQVGSRGLPWTSGNPSRSSVSGWAASQARVSSPMASRVHSAAAPGVDVERLDLAAAERRRVVVAADADRAELAEPGDDLVGVGPVAHDVAQVPDLVDRRDRREDRVERREVRVDVGQDRDPHRSARVAQPAVRRLRAAAAPLRGVAREAASTGAAARRRRRGDGPQAGDAAGERRRPARARRARSAGAPRRAPRRRRRASRRRGARRVRAAAAPSSTSSAERADRPGRDRRPRPGRAGRGERLRPGSAPTATRRSRPVASMTVRRGTGPSCRPSRRAARALRASAAASGSPGSRRPTRGPGAGSRRAAQQRDRGERVEDVERGRRPPGRGSPSG